MKVKEIGFVGIPVTEMERARKFYEGVLGLEQSEQFMEGRWIEYAVGDNTIAIASIGSDDWRPSDQGTSVALEMEDFDQAIRELQKAGVKFAMDAMESPVCHMAVVQDPDGNKVVIHKRKATS